MKIPVHFAHGNGFPSECYQELFDYLSKDMDVHYLPMAGHAAHKVTDNWAYLVDELLESIRTKHAGKVVGIGHSMGGVLMYMAACKEPQLFRQLILLDSPMPGFWRSLIIKFAKQFNLMQHFMPVDVAQSRRVHFDSPEEAYHYFRKKSLFKHFTAKSLELYVKYGLVQSEHEYVLRFSRDTEAKIFATIPDNLYSYVIPSTLKASLIYSVYSDVVKPQELVAAKDHYQLDIHPIHRGTHLFPFEHPSLTAKMIIPLVIKE